MKNVLQHAWLALPLAVALLGTGCNKDNGNKGGNEQASTIQFIFTSDAHYGITRPAFRGQTNVDAHVVNAAMVAQMNTLPSITLPADSGVNAGKLIGSVDYLFEGGDIANRMETSATVQTAAASWEQFKTDYLTNLTLKNQQGGKMALMLVPGNHDVSNSIGYYAKMNPLIDATSMANIYNMMMGTTDKTAANFVPATDKINYSRNIGGVHFCFIQMWPDSAVRVWMEKDLQGVSASTPVVILCHDQPAVVTNHFKNPNGTHDINNTDKFDNVLEELYKDGTSSTGADDIEQRGLVAFLKKHTNIKAYFHGHAHESKLYTYTGPDNDVALATVGADSPMKGVVSSKDETQLTYAFCALDTKTMTLTVRELYWNADPANAATIKWGKKMNISLK